jgi:hypothetical protein
MRSVNFTQAEIASVASASSVEAAKEAMIAIINKAKVGNSDSPMNPRKTAFLIAQVQTRRTIDQIVKLGYNMLLAGEGLGLGTGTYQKMFTSWK